MKRIIFLYFIIYNVLINYAQPTNFEDIDLYVDSISKINYNSFEELAFNLIKPKWNDLMKTRAIFYWIATNINYDKEGLRNGFWIVYPSNYKIANDTYKFRKGVCSGYSYLFKFMCDTVGVKSKVIDGFSRTEFYEAGLPIKSSNHAWNAVNIDGVWKLLDVTWANSTAIDEKCNDYYFLTKPEEFVTNHLPENKEWQLLDKPITKDEFDKYPYFSPNFFKINFNNRGYPKKGLIETTNKEINLSIKHPEGHSILLRIYDYKINEWDAPDYTTKRKKYVTKTTINLTKKGKYLLEISFLMEGHNIIYKGLLYYTLIYN